LRNKSDFNAKNTVDETKITAMEQTQKRVFLEISRIHGGKHKFENRTNASLKILAWCERCQCRVRLIPKKEIEYKHAQTGALHVQSVLGGELIVCRNSTNT
jgi:hypothetical protein